MKKFVLVSAALVSLASLTGAASAATSAEAKGIEKTHDAPAEKAQPERPSHDDGLRIQGFNLKPFGEVQKPPGRGVGFRVGVIGEITFGRGKGP